MRILHLTDRLSERGGADWHLLGVLDALAGEHDIHLAVGYDDRTTTVGWPVSQCTPLAARTATPADLDGLCRRVRPDVIHVHNVANPWALEWAARQRAVMTVQDHRSFCPGRGKWTRAGRVCRARFGADTCAPCFTDPDYFATILALTERRSTAMREMDLVVLSHYMKEELIAAGVPGEQISVIPPFVHGLHDAEADGPPCVLFVGRLVAAKGVHDAIEAWHRSQVDLPLVIAGTGKERVAAERSGCQVTGWLSHASLARLYGRAAAVLLPSRWQEPFGIVGLEALGMGVPVVAYDSGGVCEWHPGEGLVAWGDIDGLAGALRRVIGHRTAMPPGFERQALMADLLALYQTVRDAKARDR